MPALADRFKNHELVVDALTRCEFAPAGTAITCAVSGGADSMALLVLAVASGCAVTAVHVDHGLRPNSAVEAMLQSPNFLLRTENGAEAEPTLYFGE